MTLIPAGFLYFFPHCRDVSCEHNIKEGKWVRTQGQQYLFFLSQANLVKVSACSPPCISYDMHGVIRQHINLLVQRRPDLWWQVCERSPVCHSSVLRMELHFSVILHKTPRICVRQSLFLDITSQNKNRDKAYFITNILTSTVFSSASSISQN